MRGLYYVYILANQNNTVLYVGVTNDLIRRVREHREKQVDGFTKKYNVCKLVHYEATEDVTSAIAREKRLKKGTRRLKLDLIRQSNPYWKDLYSEIVGSGSRTRN